MFLHNTTVTTLLVLLYANTGVPVLLSALPSPVVKTRCCISWRLLLFLWYMKVLKYITSVFKCLKPLRAWSRSSINLYDGCHERRHHRQKKLIRENEYNIHGCLLLCVTVRFDSAALLTARIVNKTNFVYSSSS